MRHVRASASESVVRTDDRRIAMAWKVRHMLLLAMLSSAVSVDALDNGFVLPAMGFSTWNYCEVSLDVHPQRRAGR